MLVFQIKWCELLDLICGFSQCSCYPFCLSFIKAAKANLEKAQAELASAASEALRAEVQISIEANEAIVKALE